MCYKPELTHAGFNPIHSVTVWDEQGCSKTIPVAGEQPLTLVVNNYEIVTLMTFGAYPEALAIGYLRNQGLIKQLRDIKAVHVDWQTERVVVNTDQHYPLKHSAATSCAQGAILSTQRQFSLPLLNSKIKQSFLYTLLQALTQYNKIHRKTGGVHSCALCQETQILAFIEDVGRHNAVDAIAGLMWLYHWPGDNKIFYTTGRLSAEMVMKVIHMGIPILLSRSGVTYRGIKLAQQHGMTLIAHAKEQHFLIFSGETNIIFDANTLSNSSPKNEPE